MLLPILGKRMNLEPAEGLRCYWKKLSFQVLFENLCIDADEECLGWFGVGE
jgi:hypothetical protein